MPMIDIGAGLRELGHDATLLTGSEFADLAFGAGLPVIALPEDIQIVMVTQWRVRRCALRVEPRCAAGVRRR